MESAAQEVFLFGGQGQALTGVGWAGFTDLQFLGSALLSLVLATALGAAIAFHPNSRRTIDTIEETEAPKVHLMYAVVGAIIGLMVLKYGLVMGFVIFGIGGLLRFRTLVRSAQETGQVIFVTLIGLSCGLDLPHVAMLATLFGFALIHVLGAQITYRIVVKGLHKGSIAEAAMVYRRVLEATGCQVLSERKRLGRTQVTFIFRTACRVDCHDLERALEEGVPEELQGVIDWEVH